MTTEHIDAQFVADKHYEIRFTLFRDWFARFKIERTATLGELAGALMRNVAARKEDLPWIKLAVFGDLKSDKGSLRWDNNLIAVTGVELDYDGGKVSFDDARELLIGAGVLAILYTSPSHTVAFPRWRVLAPFSCKMAAAERERMLARLNGLLGGVGAPESFSLSQSYYYGQISGLADGDPRVDVIEGTPVNLLASLDAGAVGRGGPRKANGDGRGHGFMELEELIRRIVAGESLHPSVLSIAGKMAARGDSRETCIEVIGGAFEAAKVERYTDARWTGDVLRTIDYVYEKEAAKHAAETKAEFPAGATVDDFFYDLERGDYIYTPLMTHWPARSISAHLPKIANGGDKPAKPARWIAEHKPVHQKLWAPGFPQIVVGKHLLDGGEWLGKDGIVSLNSYVAPAVRPGRPEGARPWLDLVRKLYPVDMEHNHLIRTMAYKLQNPAVKINHMIIIGGSKRIGKDSILEPFKRGVGYRNVAVTSPNMIMSDFNRYAQSLLLHVSETRDLGEVKKTIFAEKLKGLIAAPPHVIPINDKHKSVYSVLNACLVIATTNHRTDSLYVTEDDGRYFPIWSDVVKEDFEPLFFAEFHEWLDANGTDDVLAYLRTLDVSDYLPKMLPPVTDLFLEMVDQSRPAEFDWVGEAITAQGHHPVITIEGLAGHAAEIDAKQFLANRGKRKFVAFLLEQHGYVRVPCPTTKDKRWNLRGGGAVTVYGLRQLSPKERERLAREMVER